MADKLLNVKDVADRMGLGVMAVYRRIWSGQLTAVDLRMRGASKPNYKIRESALAAFLDANTIEHPTRRVA